MNKYREERLIGKGSYGQVFLVTRRSDGARLVLKQMKAARNKKEREAYRLEIELLQNLHHPGIVQFIESFAHRKTLCIVMSFCEGGDLNGLVKRRRGRLMSEREVARLFVQMALAIHFMHSQHIMHRDLKAQNVFLQRGLIKLGDFGIARILDDTADMAQTQIGTPYYMSPELYQNEAYNAKSDVWALGCVLYELCTLKHAFDARSIAALGSKVIAGRFKPLPSRLFSGTLQRIVSRMLKVNPDKRPSLQELLRMDYFRPHIKSYVNTVWKHRKTFTARELSSFQGQLRELRCFPFWVQASSASSSALLSSPKSKRRSRSKDNITGSNSSSSSSSSSSKKKPKKKKQPKKRVVLVKRKKIVQAPPEPEVVMEKEHVARIKDKLRLLRLGKPAAAAARKPPAEPEPDRAVVEPRKPKKTKAKNDSLDEISRWRAELEAELDELADQWQQQQKKAPEQGMDEQRLKKLSEQCEELNATVQEELVASQKRQPAVEVEVEEEQEEEEEEQVDEYDPDDDDVGDDDDDKQDDDAGPSDSGSDSDNGERGIDDDDDVVDDVTYREDELLAGLKNDDDDDCDHDDNDSKVDVKEEEEEAAAAESETLSPTIVPMSSTVDAPMWAMPVAHRAVALRAQVVSMVGGEREFARLMHAVEKHESRSVDKAVASLKLGAKATRKLAELLFIQMH